MAQNENLFFSIIVPLVTGVIVVTFLILAVQTSIEVKQSTERYYLNATLDNNETRWQIDIIFTTDDVFSARTDLKVDIFARPLYNNLQAPHSLYLYLKDATHDPPIFVGREVVTPEFAIDNLASNSEFHEQQSIRYQSQGQKYIAVSSVQLHRLPHNFSQLFEVIQLSSEDSKYQYDTNRSILALTFVTVALAVAASYKFIKDVTRALIGLFTLRRNR